MDDNIILIECVDNKIVVPESLENINKKLINLVLLYIRQRDIRIQVLANCKLLTSPNYTTE